MKKTLKQTAAAYLQAYETVQQIREDADTREGYICINIKIYARWDYEKTREDYIKELSLTKTQANRVREEFDDNRAQGIADHVNEWEVSYMKDWIGGCAYNRDEPERKHLQYFDSRNVWQFGRMGGWLSIMKTADLEAYQEEHYEELQEIADKFTGTHPEINYRQAVKYWKDNAYYEDADSVEQIKHIFAHYCKDLENFAAAYNFVSDYVQRSKEGIIDAYSEQLRNEIADFCEDQLKPLSVRVKAADRLVKIEEGKVYTQRGAAAPLKDLQKLLQAIHEGHNVIGCKAGTHTVTKCEKYRDDRYYTVGCHFISLSHVQQFINAQTA